MIISHGFVTGPSVLYTEQKPNLILNVDGLIGVAFVDLLRTCGGFTRLEKELSCSNAQICHNDKITTFKVAFCSYCALFSDFVRPSRRDEADEFVEVGALNGIFVLGRSMGFIGELFLLSLFRLFLWCQFTARHLIGP